jgi:hypothetical protein
MWQDEHLENASDLSVDSNNRQKVNDFVNDNRRFKVKRINNEGRMKNVEIFASGPTDYTIRNAVSGFKYEGHKVGTLDEDLYFKVAFSTGEAKFESPTLFYDSPEQFENHLFQELPQSNKEKWHNKMLNAKYGVRSSRR